MAFKLAAGPLILAVGVGGAMCAMRSAVGKYTFDEAAFGLSPANLKYSVESGFWSGGIGIAVLLLSWHVCLRRKLTSGVTFATSVGIAVTAVVAITFVKCFYWAAMSSV